MVMHILAWTKTGKGVAVLAAINLLLVAPLVWLGLDSRSARLANEQHDAAVAVELMAWRTAELYAPVTLTVDIGSTPETTVVTEEPSFDGPRVLEPFPGEWITHLRRADTDTLECTMPQTGPRPASYSLASPSRFKTDWLNYTKDEGGRCFAKMQPCQWYDLTTVRRAERVIDGERQYRFLDPVRSPKFQFPCGPKAAGQ